VDRQIVNNQHYVPKGIIKNFADKAGYIDVYDKKKQRILTHCSPKVCGRTKGERFYDGSHELLLQNGKKVYINSLQPLEQGYQRMEDDIIPMIREAAADCSLFYEKVYRQKIVLFIHSLSERTKCARKEIENTHTTTYIHFPEIFDGLNPIELSKLQHNNMQMDMQKTFRDIQDIFETYNIYPVSNKTQEPFILSDDPAGFLRHGFYEVCVPLSPTFGVLFIANGNPLNGKHAMLLDDIVHVNALGAIRYNLYQCALGESIYGKENKLKYYKTLLEKCDDFIHPA